KAGLDVDYTSSLNGFWVAGQLVLTNGLRTCRYDPGQDRWSLTSTGPSEIQLSESQGFALGNRAYLFYSGYMNEYVFGRSVNTYLHFWEFDPTR
ncbi:MAG: hypothetical protein H7Y12_10730, partial [Sphingobacteriaceae bacterium]|nr:hypothetical protein [Cytophagaceae bacterium]